MTPRSIPTRAKLAAGVAGAALCIAALPAAAHADSCSALAATALPNATITAAATVPAGTYTLPPTQLNTMFSMPGLSLTGSTSLPKLASFCRITATLTPTPQSSIGVEIFMPSSGWNGKFLGVGNFGFAGALNEAGMVFGLADGYATATTDTGHTVSDGSFAIGNPQALIDFAYRADHLMALDAKAIIKAFYGAGPTHSYWVGCSLGGLEGIVEAKRYPGDFDGVVSGAPPNPYVDFNIQQLWPGYISYHDPDKVISAATLTAVQAHVVAQCGGPVGSQQGFVENPNECTFQPSQIVCSASYTAADCLTADQAEALSEVYHGPNDTITGKLVFPGPAKGGEAGFSLNGSQSPVSLGLFTQVLYQGDGWNWQTQLNYGPMLAYARQQLDGLFNVSPDDLKPFLARGGKMLFYIGWNDGHNPDQLTSFYLKTIEAAGFKGITGMRLFTIPGMNHCYNGNGCDTFDKLDTLATWVEQGQAPARIITSKVVNGAVVRTRPICAWPTTAQYKGTGSITDAASFSCVIGDL